jgi:hypothetical protein
MRGSPVGRVADYAGFAWADAGQREEPDEGQCEPDPSWRKAGSRTPPVLPEARPLSTPDTVPAMAAQPMSWRAVLGTDAAVRLAVWIIAGSARISSAHSPCRPTPR